MFAQPKEKLGLTMSFPTVTPEGAVLWFYLFDLLPHFESLLSHIFWSY